MIGCQQKLTQLQIDDQYKQTLQKFCADPKNAQKCEMLCQADPAELEQTFKRVEGAITQWGNNGMLSKVSQQIQAGEPEQSFANGGLATFGRNGDDQYVHAKTGEVMVPPEVLQQNPQLSQGIASALSSAGANPSRYVVGNQANSINPMTGQPEFFLDKLGDAVGAIVGTVVGATLGPVAGLSMALGAGIGATVGSVAIDGRNLKDSIGIGFGVGTGAYALESMGVIGGTISPADLLSQARAKGVSVEVMGSELGAPSNIIGKAKILQGTSAPTVAQAAGQGVTSAAEQAATQAAKSAGTMVPQQAAQTLAKPSFGEFIKGGGGLENAVLYSGDKFNVTAGDALKAAPYIAAMFEDREPADTNPWKHSRFNQPPAFAQRGEPMMDLQSYQRAQQMQRPIMSLQGRAPGYTYGGHVRKDFQQGGMAQGPGTEQSDSIPARLSNNEFVMTADAVRGMGNGDLRSGAQRMYSLMDQLERRNGQQL